MKRAYLYSLTLVVCAALVVTISHAQETVTIGTQVWMAKNLNVDKFRNGDPIPHAKTYEEWKAAGDNKRPAWCYYDNDPANGAKYGKLYNWYAVNDSRGLAPAGFHVPSDVEWTTLENQLGSDPGTKMKSASGWDDSANGTNSSGFNGKAGGYRVQGPAGPQGVDNGFHEIGASGCWWSSSMKDNSNAFFQEIGWDDSYLPSQPGRMTSGNSVRCIRDIGQDAPANSSPALKTVTIGSQSWMTKNLDVTTFRNGDPIPEAKTNEEWEMAGKNKKPAWCYYQNDPTNGEKYGKLYNWYAVNDPRYLEPVGYHIPSAKEWKVLVDYLGGGDAAGAKMKSTSGWGSWSTGGDYSKTCPNCKDWNTEYRRKVPCHTCKDTRQVTAKKPIVNHSGNGSNSSGFSGFPGGCRMGNGMFHLGSFGSGSAHWWCSDEEPYSPNGLCFFIWSWHDSITRDSDEKKSGFSVRCVKD